MMLGSKVLKAWNCQNSLSSAGTIVALRIDKDALCAKTASPFDPNIIYIANEKELERIYNMKKEYRKKDFKIAQAIALFLTVACLIVCSVSCIEEIVEMSSAVRIVTIMISILIIIGVIIGWYICINRYIELVFETTKNIWRLYTRIGLAVLCGVVTFFGALNIVIYVVNNWNLLDGIYSCIVINGIMIVCWCICLGYSIYCVKKNDLIEELKIRIFVLVILMSIGSLGYTYWKTENVWFEKMVEYYEQHGDNYKVEPFSRN